MAELYLRAGALLQRPVVRFLLAGGLNTLLTYVLYLVLLNAFSYKTSYAITYVAGLVIAYLLNRLFVFNSHRGAASALLLPLVYLFQYLIGAGIVYAWVELIGQDERVAPLIAVVVTIPLTYVLSRTIFVKHA
ncbi:GtrA family protein [Massilia sp. IC2-477]|uniref:GtrA family protein n=1 Tax=Massilia sp. IC2-477 TaxID=2887198 RepID=UPI001D10DE51|nr:GtrA family protein [Massilia sp. IC2-477]MCC2957033.1 GtrA family protein [Massilia sp. IC2-477]